ncbi:MAG: AraC family transcriptional regulator [Firmicutes bacterium]|nr:AraC family transcriptional regulator [Bacillota bacterium]
MEAWHQRNLTYEDYPFNIFVTDIPEFPPHWHEELEIIYVLEEELVIGLNNEIYTLKPRDILLINSSEVHFFVTPPKKSNRIILQFEPRLFGPFSAMMREHKFITPHLSSSNESQTQVHQSLERQTLSIIDEYSKMRQGFQLAIQARLYDFMVVLLRQVPMEKYSSLERSKHLKRLERLEHVFKYVAANYTKEITLNEIARTANFSVYHFTRFFKETTGMTFIQYLNNYRVSKAVKLLTETDDSITEVAFRSGFDSIKTFNRVFKHLKGCSPSSFKKQRS